MNEELSSSQSTLELLDENTILVLNKSDLAREKSQNKSTHKEKLKKFKLQLQLSCHTNEGVPQFLQHLEYSVAKSYAISLSPINALALFLPRCELSANDEPVITRVRHRELLIKCVGCLQCYLGIYIK